MTLRGGGSSAWDWPYCSHSKNALFSIFFLSNSFQTCSEQFEYKFTVGNEASTIMVKFYSLR